MSALRCCPWFRGKLPLGSPFHTRIFSSAFARCMAAHQEAGPKIPNTCVFQHINQTFLDGFLCCYLFFSYRREMFSPRAPIKSEGRFGTSWGSSGMLKKSEEIFQDRDREENKPPANNQLSVGNDRLRRYYRAGQQDAWLD